ncbi:MAG: DUF72 domain-containing protein [Bacillota bacterium]
MILVGTSGYSYLNWVGPFYPEGTKRDDMLQYYAARFPLTELDFTYYQMPGLKTMEGLARKSPPGFSFAVKAHRDMTHNKALSASGREEATRLFYGALAPLRERGKLSCILLQFPYAFQKNPSNMDALARFRDWIPDAPLVVEFRHISWVNEDTFDFLRGNGYNFCCVDEPALAGLFPPLAVATGPIGYIRFHGRNKAKWWRHKEAWERYDYLYSDAELMEWIPKIRILEKHTDTLLILFNNCHFGQAVRNALKLQKTLFQGINPVN